MNAKRILLADDNPNDVELALCALEELGMADAVAVVQDGEEALHYLRREGKYRDREPGNPDVAVLDLKMPKVSGLQVLEAVKGDPKFQAMPAVMLTSSREECDLAASYRAGANAYIVKPVDFEKFVQAVKEIGIFWGGVNEPPPVCSPSG
jgi:CheY-like chemotaxis protein